MRELVVDIETYPLDDAAQFIEEPSAPANYKDPDKIKAYVEDAKVKAISRCALDVDLCRIVAIGTEERSCGSSSGPIVSLGLEPEIEASLLEQFWLQAAKARMLIGFNLLAFDLPVLIRRSQYLGVATLPLNLDRYRTPHADLMERLSFNGKLKYRSLEFYCRRFGIHVSDEHTGKEISDLVRAGDFVGVTAHCAADVEKTRQLAERLGVIQARAAA